MHAFTGHRPQRFGFDPYPRMAALAARYMHECRPEGIISGVALGWDQAVAWAAVAANVPVHAAVPFVGQESRWIDADRARYARLLSCCASVTVVSDGGYENWKYHARNRWMVDRCTRLVALWDGGDKGGTAACVRYATQVGRPIVNLWDAFMGMKP